MFKEYCQTMLQTLQCATPRNDDEYRAVQDRLNKSFHVYEQELQKSLSYLSKKNALLIVKRINTL